VRQLTLSLLLVVVGAVIGLGWGIDQWYNAQYAPQENQSIKSYEQLGRELVNLISVASVDNSLLEQWAEQSKTHVQITPYVEFPIPPNLKQSFEAGEPLMLDSGAGISLHYYVAAQQSVISFSFPAEHQNGKNSRLSWLLTLLFYGGVILVVFIWLYPLLKRLLLLRQKARAFGAGDLSVRIPQGAVSYIVDIEQEFNRMAQRIESLVYDNKLLSRGLSHDLRTPIARLRFGLDVLEEAELSPAQQKTLAHLNRDLIAMETLVETLLSYSRMDQAQIAFKPALVNLQQWVADIAQEFYPEQVQFDCPPSGYATTITADTEYLNMLIHNLLQNAERHGKGIIQASVIATEKNVALVVEDNGSGIPEVEREHVLKPFYRIASAQNTQGHGMGLAIVDRIAQWHKAELKLETSESLGGLKISVIFARGKMFGKSE
jgi:two-component system OmpR family sensor kinase